MRRFLLSMATILLFSSCNELATLKYYPFPDVAVVLKIKKVAQHENGQDIYTFVHISYSIDQLSDEPLSFEVYNIKVTMNGISNTSAYYDTIASVVPGPLRIGKGETNLHVYVVFPGVIKVSKDTKFAILNLGLSQSVTIKSPFAPVDRSLTRLHYQNKHTSTQKSRKRSFSRPH